MSMLQSHTTTTPRMRSGPQAASIYKITEGFHSIANAWESIATGQWSTSAVQSFAALARRTALEFSTLGCGALDRAVVELVLALDAITVASTISAQQIERVDHVVAHIRAITTQRIMAMELSTLAVASEYAPVFCDEPCARCSASGVCAILRRHGD